MHRLFVPVPDWLDQSKELKAVKSCYPPPHSNEFLLETFLSLYQLGLTDRQVVELTTLFIVLAEQDLFYVEPTKPKAEKLGSFSWYRKGSKFCLSCFSLTELINEWVKDNLSKDNTRSCVSQTFWGGAETWLLFFIRSGTEKQFIKLVERTKIRFAQHCLNVPMTGVWDSRSIEACKNFQGELPKVLIPWKNGGLDGFTYKILARGWKKRKGLLKLL
jgi:hypothetical protein